MFWFAHRCSEFAGGEGHDPLIQSACGFSEVEFGNLEVVSIAETCRHIDWQCVNSSVVPKQVMLRAGDLRRDPHVRSASDGDEFA